MDNEEKIYCFDNTKVQRQSNCSMICLNIIATIILSIFVGTIGLIIGAALSTTILDALAAIIVLAVILRNTIN